MEKKTGRLEAFSDGIFGVAITLLAVSIGISAYPDPTDRSLWTKILDKWPEYFTYFNSFATVLLIWMGHHNMLNRIWRANHLIILLNGLVLLFVVLFPYPTKVVGSFIDTPAIHTAVAFYTGFTGIIVVSMLLLNVGIVKSKGLIINPEKDLDWFAGQIKQQILAILVYAVASCIAFYEPFYALGITFLMWIFWAFVTKETLDG